MYKVLSTSKHYFFLKFAKFQEQTFYLGKRKREIINVMFFPSGVATMLALGKFPMG
jgi:hypothetical protein